MTQRVFVDANILLSKTLRDWLFLLRTDTGSMFQLHTTDDVLTEVKYHMRKKYTHWSGDRMNRQIQQFRKALDEVFSSFRSDVPFSGNDPGDYHVHAAAHACGASYLLTNNKPDDFTSGGDPYEIIAADDFLEIVGSSRPTVLPGIVAEQIDYWASKPAHLQLDDALCRADCPRFADRIGDVLRRQALIVSPD